MLGITEGPGRTSTKMEEQFEVFAEPKDEANR